jgi:hypothetical protein
MVVERMGMIDRPFLHQPRQMLEMGWWVAKARKMLQDLGFGRNFRQTDQDLSKRSVIIRLSLGERQMMMFVV